MSDGDSGVVDLQSEEASAASTSASTPQPAPKADPTELQELLQLRAKQAIEGAKARNEVRENQRMADDYVHTLLRRCVVKLGWLEEERREREKNRKKLIPAALSSDRPSRRRERKKEFRNRQSPEYEEVPGGGQFLMMLLGKNKQASEGKSLAADSGSTGRKGERGGNSSPMEAVEAPPGLSRRVEGSRFANRAGLRGDPAIVQVSAALEPTLTPLLMEPTGPPAGPSPPLADGRDVSTGREGPEATTGLSGGKGSMNRNDHVSSKGSASTRHETSNGKGGISSKSGAAGSKGASSSKADPLPTAGDKLAKGEKGGTKGSKYSADGKAGASPKGGPSRPVADIEASRAACRREAREAREAEAREAEALRQERAQRHQQKTGAPDRGTVTAESTSARAGSPENGSPRAGEQLNLQSLLRAAGITESDDLPSSPSSKGRKGPRATEAQATDSEEPGAVHVSKASTKIFGRLQSLMGMHEERTEGLQAQPQVSPLIPPMPGFGSIWGSPSPVNSSGTSPVESPWSVSQAPPGCDIWTPLPPSAFGDHGSPLLRPSPAGKGLRPPPPPPPPPGGFPDMVLAPTSAQAGAASAAATSSRGRRGGKHRHQRAERVQDEDLWDMPTPQNAMVDAALPEFFRDSLAPPFVDHVLGGDVEDELEVAKGAQNSSDRGDDAFLGPSVLDALGVASLVEDDDEDEVVLRNQIVLQ